MDISNLGQLAQGGLIDTISRFVGGSREATQKTLGAAIPTTMYAVADQGSTEIGAAGLLEGLKTGQAPQLDVSDLGRTLSDPQASERLMSTSGGFLEKLFGSKASGVVNGLSSIGGGDRSVTAKVLALAAPMALGVIGKRVREGGLDAHGLAGFLGDQKSKVAALVPGPLRSILGVPATVEPRVPVAAATIPGVPRREVATPRVVPHVARPAPERSRWPIWVAALAALFGLGWLLTRAMRTSSPPTVAAPTEPKPTIPTPVPPKPVAPTPSEIEGTRPATPPAEANANAPKGPIADFLANGGTEARRFTLESVNFATGDATLNPEAQSSVQELATALKAHPGASVRIEGFADTTGNADINRQLGQARADAVKSALVADGIGGD